MKVYRLNNLVTVSCIIIVLLFLYSLIIQEEILPRILLSGIILIFIFIIINGFSIKYIISNEGISVSSMFFGMTQLKWDEINVIAISPYDKRIVTTIYLYSSSKKDIAIMTYTNNYKELVAQVINQCRKRSNYLNIDQRVINIINK